MSVTIRVVTDGGPLDATVDGENNWTVKGGTRKIRGHIKKMLTMYATMRPDGDLYEAGSYYTVPARRYALWAYEEIKNIFPKSVFITINDTEDEADETLIY